MSGKLHLICMKTEKLDVILTTFHTSVKRRKIIFNSYNYSQNTVTSLVITEYSISDINLLGTDIFPLKFH